jgi:hypothetical protein
MGSRFCKSEVNPLATYPLPSSRRQPPGTCRGVLYGSLVVIYQQQPLYQWIKGWQLEVQRMAVNVRIVVWTLGHREKIIEWETPASVVSLAMSQDSETLASGHHDGTVMMWNAWTGNYIVARQTSRRLGLFCVEIQVGRMRSQIVTTYDCNGHCVTYTKVARDLPG